MTCIAGVARNGKVTIGGDSAGVAGLDLTVRADEKVFRKGAYVIGYTSSFRMGQLLRWKVDLPDPGDAATSDAPPDGFMATTFIDAARGAFKEGGYMHVENGREDAGVFLVGFGHWLYRVGSDLQVGRSANGLDACGCGESFALGALSAIGESEAPDIAVRKALGIAETWCAGVRAPFTILTTGEE